MASSSRSCLTESGILKTTTTFSVTAESWLSSMEAFSSQSLPSSSKLLRVPESPSSTLELSESVRNLGSAPRRAAPILCFFLLFSFLKIRNVIQFLMAVKTNLKRQKVLSDLQ